MDKPRCGNCKEWSDCPKIPEILYDYDNPPCSQWEVAPWILERMQEEVARLQAQIEIFTRKKIEQVKAEPEHRYKAVCEIVRKLKAEKREYLAEMSAMRDKVALLYLEQDVDCRDLVDEFSALLIKYQKTEG